jgi:hypothetical protein
MLSQSRDAGEEKVDFMQKEIGSWRMEIYLTLERITHSHQELERHQKTRFSAASNMLTAVTQSYKPSLHRRLKSRLQIGILLVPPNCLLFNCEWSWKERKKKKSPMTVPLSDHWPCS